MSDWLQHTWQTLKSTENLALIGTGAAIIAAIASVWSLWNQKTAEKQEAEANKPIASLQINAGNEKALSIFLSIGNPGKVAVRFTEIRVLEPRNWKILNILITKIGSSPVAENANSSAKIDIISFPQRASAVSTERSQTFIIQDPSVTGDERSNMQQSPPFHVPDNLVKVLIKGHTLNSDASPIEIEATGIPAPSP